MTEQTNTPKLRFPEFKNEWSYDLLGDVVTNKSKKFDPKKEEATKDIELDSIEQNTGRLLDTYISNDFTSQKNKFKKDNVLYSKLRPYLNKYYYATIDGVCSSEIWVLNTLNKDVLVNKFLYYFIQTNRFSSVTNKSAGSKMPRADWELVKNIRLYKGSIKEQEKIGYFFSKLDRQIELEEQKLSLLEEQKKGYMQKIFSQELRFKDENGNEYPEWEEKEINSVLEKIIDNRGKTPENNSTEIYPMLEVNSLGNYYPKYNKVAKFVSEKTYKTWFREHIKLNDVLFSTVGNTGLVSLMDNNKAVIAQNIVGLRINSENDATFLYYLLSYWENQKKVKQIQMGAVQPSVKVSQFKYLKFYFPTKDEQQEIGVFLTIFDKIFEEQSKKIEILKERKQGLLQKMFI